MLPDGTPSLSVPVHDDATPLGSQPLEPEPLDVLVVGCGFAGIYQLYRHRNLGHSVKIFDSASDLGGVWYWNCYPGARVDSDVPNYELSLPQLWKDWNWSEKYPGRQELRRYFEHVEKKLDLKKDIRFNTRVLGARWDQGKHVWIVEAEDRSDPRGSYEIISVRTRFIVLCTGFAAKVYVPDFSGLDAFRGICYHTSQWPQAGLDLRGQRVGVVGTGASGVQIVQELGPQVEHLTVFQRTPNLAIPMRQEKIDEKSSINSKNGRAEMYEQRKYTAAGFNYDKHHRSSLQATPKERLAYLEELWTKGGMRFIFQNFNDLRTNQELNDEVYAFWRQKVRERINDPILQEKLAPTIPPHPMGVKRASLEQNYYEIFNQPNVSLIDLAESPITKVTCRGILTADGVEHELDCIVLATGFDSITGGIMQIDLKGVDGSTIKDKWKSGVHSYLGMATANFPNLFFVHGPQAPTAICNGPSCAEIQGDWIINCIQYLKNNNFTRIEADPKAEDEWREKVLELSARGLWGKARSWYRGSNIPGKAIEQLIWTGGVPLYHQTCQEKVDKGYEGFLLS